MTPMTNIVCSRLGQVEYNSSHKWHDVLPSHHGSHKLIVTTWVIHMLTWKVIHVYMSCGLQWPFQLLFEVTNYSHKLLLWLILWFYYSQLTCGHVLFWFIIVMPLGQSLVVWWHNIVDYACQMQMQLYRFFILIEMVLMLTHGNRLAFSPKLNLKY